MGGFGKWEEAREWEGEGNVMYVFQSYSIFDYKEEGDSTEGVERKCVYRVRATLWVDLRDWEGGRVQHIDTILLLGRYSVLEMANGSKR